MPDIYLIPIPISENDVENQLSPQVKEIISRLDYYLAENVRTARRFISSLKTGVIIDNLHFEVLDKNTKYEDLPGLMKPLKDGNNMGILSESGCPGIADPGSMAVDYAHKMNARVYPLVGPSSIFLALMASGMNGQKFCFHGYLPIDERQRQKAIKKLEQESRKMEQTQIFMETPYRNEKLLNTLLNTCKKETRLCIARDILGKRQLIETRKIGEWKKQPPELNKIPAVFLLQS